MRHQRQSERGYALLVIFLMAAMVALMLYKQLPRVAFERERDREQLLIDRGKGYQRGIELYFRANNRWPQRIEDLEDTNDKRFLRKRYKDPYTGKDEWRVIHTNGSALTDSLVEKPPDVNGTSGSNSGSSTSTTTQTNDPNAAPQVNAAAMQRPSDRSLPGAQSYSNPTPPQFPGQTAPNQVPGQPGFGQPVQLPAGIQLPNGVQAGAPPANFQPQFPGQVVPGQNGQQPNGQQANANANPGGFVPQFPGQQFPGQPPPPGVQINNNANTNNPNANPNGFVPQFPGQQPPPGVQPQQNPAQPGLNPNFSNQLGGQQQSSFGGQQQSSFGGQQQSTFGGQQQPQFGAPGGGQATPSGAQNNAALGLINQLLTTPRQAPNGLGAVSQGNSMGGGIAGFASTHTGPSIKVFNDRSKYEEWEFVYTPSQSQLSQANAAANGGRGGTGATGGANGGRGGQQGGLPGLGGGSNLPGMGGGLPGLGGGGNGGGPGRGGAGPTTGGRGTFGVPGGLGGGLGGPQGR